MDREAIEERITRLRASLVEIQATYAATQGAIQDCEYWLARLNEADQPTPSEGTSEPK